MLKGKKLFLIIAAMLVVSGLVFVFVGFGIIGFRPQNLNTVKNKTETVLIEEDFSSIKVNAAAEDIVFKPTTDEKASVAVNTKENNDVSVAVVDNELRIDVTEGKWNFGINFTDAEYNIIVLLPKKAFNSIEVNSTSGDVDILTNVSAADVNIKTTSGEISFCGNAVNLTADSTSGEISVQNTQLQNNMIITDTSGDVELENCDASYIEITTTSGDVSGELLSEKKFEIKTTSGEVEIPHTKANAVCKVTTTSGDIEFE